MKISKINLFLSISSLVFLVLLAVAFFWLKSIWIDEISLYLFLLFSIVVILVMLSFYFYFIWAPLQNILDSIKTLISWKTYTPIEINREDEIWSISHFINQVVWRVQDLSWEIQEWRRVVWEVNTASQIQKSVIPQEVPEWIIWIDIVARSKSSSEVWWDNFDIIKQWKNTLFYIWDVTGHWVPAALIMMMANTAIRSFSENNLSSKEILSKTNKLLFEKISTNHFMSAVMFRWDNERQRMFFTWAWHETIIHFSSETWEVTNIKTWWIALKMLADISWMLNEREIDFKYWDILVVYSDWITESKNQFWERYWLDRFLEKVKKVWHGDAWDVFKGVTTDFSDYIWSVPPEDDVTLIVIKNIWQYWSTSMVDIWSSSESTTWITWMRWDWD